MDHLLWMESMDRSQTYIRADTGGNIETTKEVQEPTQMHNIQYITSSTVKMGCFVVPFGCSLFMPMTDKAPVPKGVT